MKNKKQKEQNTVKNLILNWYTNYIEKHRAQPLQIWQYIKVDIIPLLGNKKLEHLKTREINQALDKIVGRGSPVHANKVLSNSDYVITGTDDQSILSDRAMPRAVIRIQSRVGIPHWTAHDLRRSFATQLGEALHVDPVVIEKCLGHKMPKIMATYNKNEMLPQRKESLNAWSELIENMQQDNVVIIQPQRISE